MNRVEAKRLLRLAGFLYNLPRKLFNLSEVVYEGGLPPRDALKAGGGCGTVGCAMGWTPVVFPRLVEWYDDSFEGRWGASDVQMKDGSGADCMDAVAVELFGLAYGEVDRLFYPDQDRGVTWEATPKQVAKSLSAFALDAYPDLGGYYAEQKERMMAVAA